MTQQVKRFNYCGPTSHGFISIAFGNTGTVGSLCLSRKLVGDKPQMKVDSNGMILLPVEGNGVVHISKTVSYSIYYLWESEYTE